MPNSNKTFLEGSYEIFYSKYPKKDIIIQCHFELKKHIKDLLGKNYPHINTEPAQKGTAPAVGMAVMGIYNKNKDETITIAYSDHPVSFKNKLLQGIDDAVKFNKNLKKLILIGVNPTFPAENYGYVKIGGVLQEIGPSIAFEMVDFIEKPGRAHAEKLLQSWRYLWNTGYLVAKASEIVDTYEKTLPGIYKGLLSIFPARGTKLEKEITETVYKSFQKTSLDKGIYEKIDRTSVAVLPVDLQIHDFSDF